MISKVTHYVKYNAGLTNSSPRDSQLRIFCKYEQSLTNHHSSRGSSLMDGTLPVTEESLKDFTSTEMERGLLATLMGPSDEGTIKRNKERRKSIKERRRSAAAQAAAAAAAANELKRSRTRENNVLREEEEYEEGTEV